MRRALTATILIALAGCGGAASTPRTPESAAAAQPTPTATKAPPKPPALCDARKGTVVGTVTDPSLEELSGLTRIGSQLWAIEDSGAAPVLIALRADGSLQGRTAVTGASNVDWEDLAGDGRGELFAADIGDNAHERDSIQVYRVAAPAPGTAAVAGTRIDLRYPDGAHDAESLLVDTARGQIVVITKELFGARAFVAPLSAPASTLRAARSVPVAVATGASLSADGRIVAVRTYGTLSIWRRRGTEPLARTLSRRPCVAPVDLAPEGQGEAVALSKRGATALTVPEGTPAAIRRYAAN